MIATYKLTNGDLAGMDAGQLREHAVAYLTHNRQDEYAEALIRRMHELTGFDPKDIHADIQADVQR